jgi:hypothetical protein
MADVHVAQLGEQGSKVIPRGSTEARSKETTEAHALANQLTNYDNVFLLESLQE